MGMILYIIILITFFIYNYNCVVNIAEKEMRILEYQDRMKIRITPREYWGLGKEEQRESGILFDDDPLHIDTMTSLNPSTPFWVFDDI